MNSRLLAPLFAAVLLSTAHAQGPFDFDDCGILVDGVECSPLFMDSAGCLWVIGPVTGFGLGDSVRVIGTADTGCITTCQQGCGCIFNATITSCVDDPTDAYCFCVTTGPCGNATMASGCANSTGTGGLLMGSGSARVAADSLVLRTTGLPSGVSALYFMGDNQVDDPFGDGRRCVGGNVFRYPVDQASASGELLLGPGIASFAQMNFGSAIFPGQTWNFQTWYRDPNGPCGSGFNLSNAASVAFTL